jgi:hypothetical protein
LPHRLVGDAEPVSEVLQRFGLAAAEPVAGGQHLLLACRQRREGARVGAVMTDTPKSV